MTRDRPSFTDFVTDYSEVERCRQNVINKKCACVACSAYIQLVTLQRSEIMGGYNTPDTVVRDRSSKSVMKYSRIYVAIARHSLTFWFSRPVA